MDRASRKPSSSLLAHVALLAVTLVWGTTFPLVKSALADCSPLLFNLLRMLLAFTVLAAIYWKRLRHVTRREVRGGFLAGIFLALGYQLQTAGLAHTTASKSAFITGLIVVLVPLLATVPGVRPATMPATRWNGFAGALVAFAGLILLTSPAGAHAALLSGFGIGEWLSLGCAFAFAAHLLTLARVSPQMDARTLGTLQVGGAAIIMLMTLPLGGAPVLHTSPRLIIALAVTAVLATAAAFTIQSWAQKQIPASHTALLFTMEPVFAWLTSLLFLGERLSVRSLAGAATILAGILLAELWPSG